MMGSRMNIFVEKLAEGELPDLKHHENKLVVEDNVGESIHVHIRDVRIEMTVEDYLVFASAMKDAKQKLENGDH